jgi:hypothetical protein
MDSESIFIELIVVEPAMPLPKRPAGRAPFGVPRRFGVGTILVITAAFAGLLALLRLLAAPPLQVGFWIVFITLVGLGQAVLYRGRQPRLASIVSGAVCLPALIVVAMLRDRAQGNSYDNPFEFCTLIGGVLAGTACGYLAGGIVAGVFLVMDAVEKFLAKRFPRRTEETNEETALAAVVVPELVWQFAGRITWRPEARQWLEGRFGPASPELFGKSIVEHLGTGGVIERLREAYPRWGGHRFHYNVRLRLPTRTLNVDLVLRDDEPQDISLHVINAYDTWR